MSGRACILCASARSKERGASPQNLRTSAPFVARHCLSLRSTFYRSLKNTVIIGYVELLKSITCEKPRRAREAAAAARFFDESVRNSYARRAATPQTALRRQGEFRAEARKRSRRCVTLMRTPLASVSGAQQKGHGGEGNFGRQGEKDPADAESLMRSPAK